MLRLCEWAMWTSYRLGCNAWFAGYRATAEILWGATDALEGMVGRMRSRGAA